MSSLALISSWYYICTSYCTTDTDSQIEKVNQELEQDLQFFVDHRQKD